MDFPGGLGRAPPTRPPPFTPPGLPFGFTFTDFSQHNMFPRRGKGTWKLKSFVNPGKTLKFRKRRERRNRVNGVNEV